MVMIDNDDGDDDGNDDGDDCHHDHHDIMIKHHSTT